MKNIKRICITIIVVLLVFSLFACSNSETAEIDREIDELRARISSVQNSLEKGEGTMDPNTRQSLLMSIEMDEERIEELEAKKNTLK